MLTIKNTLEIAIAVISGDPDDPRNLHLLQPGDELTTALPISIVDENDADFRERRASGQSFAGRRSADAQAAADGKGLRGTFARGRQRGTRAVNRNAGGGKENPAGTLNVSGGALGGTNDGSGVLKTTSGEHVEGDRGAATKARDTGLGAKP